MASPVNATTTIPPMPAAEHYGPSSRPTLGFPLGTGLLLLVVFCLSGVFSCCYYWDKLRRLRGRTPFFSPSEASAAGYYDTDGGSHHADDLPHPPAKPNQHLQSAMQGKETDSVPVIMPGGQIPTFIAWPRPCPPPPAPIAPTPLLPSPSIKIVVVDVLAPSPRPGSQHSGAFALAPSSPS